MIEQPPELRAREMGGKSNRTRLELGAVMQRAFESVCALTTAAVRG
jgi:hypothetical protein